MNHDLKLRGKVWWLRKRVPQDVRDHVGAEVIEMSLQTRDVREARRRRDAKLAELERDWTLIRRTGDPSGFESVLEEAESERRALAGAQTSPAAPTVADRLIEQLDTAALSWGRREGLVDRLGVGVDPDELRDRFTEETSEGQRLLGQLEALRGNLPIDVAGERWLAKADLREGTKREYRRFFKTAAERLPLPPRVTRDDARLFAQWLAEEGGETGSGLSRKSVNNHLTALSRLWGHLGHDEAIWKGLSFEVAKRALRRDIWTPEEVVRLLDGAGAVQGAAGVKLTRVVRLALHTGARASEIAGMRYDAENDWIVIPREATKTDAGKRAVPCPEAIREDVKAWVADPWSGQSVTNRFSELKLGLGFHGKDKVLHSFRHTVISRFEELGVPEATAAAIAGHKNKGITYGVYGGKASVESLRETINRLDWDTRLEEERARIARRRSSTAEAPAAPANR